MRYKTIIKGLGMWRSLVAHLAWDEGVARSNRVIPTILIKDFQKFWKSFLMPLCNRRLIVHSLHILKLWTIIKIWFLLKNQCQLLFKYQTNRFRIKYGMMWIMFWIASKSKIFRNDRLNLQISQLVYSHLMKQWKNSCCLSDSEFTSFGLNLVTVFSRRCFSFLSNILSFFFAIKKKEYLVRGLGLHKPQYKITNIDRFRIKYGMTNWLLYKIFNQQQFHLVDKLQHLHL